MTEILNFSAFSLKIKLSNSRPLSLKTLFGAPKTNDQALLIASKIVSAVLSKIKHAWLNLVKRTMTCRWYKPLRNSVSSCKSMATTSLNWRDNGSETHGSSCLRPNFWRVLHSSQTRSTDSSTSSGCFFLPISVDLWVLLLSGGQIVCTVSLKPADYSLTSTVQLLAILWYNGNSDMCWFESLNRNLTHRPSRLSKYLLKALNLRLSSLLCELTGGTAELRQLLEFLSEN